MSLIVRNLADHLTKYQKIPFKCCTHRLYSWSVLVVQVEVKYELRLRLPGDKQDEAKVGSSLHRGYWGSDATNLDWSGYGS
jgi:hypothetical protein